MPDSSHWPDDLRGVSESLVTTLGPNDLWNVAALGAHAGDPVTARTWGNTRTRRNFHRQGGGYVQFTRDPVRFVNAALSIHEVEDSILPDADAWVEVEVEQVDSDTDGDTEWIEWALHPTNSGVEHEIVPVTNRGYYAVIEATVAASRLDVPAYDTDTLRDRLAYCEDLARKCGGDREQEAFDRLNDLVDWDRP